MKSELVYNLRMRNFVSKHRHPKADSTELPTIDGQQLLDYPGRRASQKGSEGRVLSLPHRASSLQDGPQ